MKPITWKRKMLPFVVAFALLGVRVASAADYPTTILADHPIAYYRFEEAPGATTVADSSASGQFPGSYVYSSDSLYPELGQPGIDTNSMLLSASESAFAYAGYYDEFNEQAPFSWEIWLRPTSLSSGGVYPCPIGNYSGSVAVRGGWYLYQVPDSPNEWGVYTSDGTYVHTDATFPFVAGQWYHLVFTYDGTNVSLYANGTLAQTKPDPTYQSQSTASSYNALFFGNLNNNPSTAFNGNEDEFAYYTNALTAAQILNHYEVGTNSFRAVATAPYIVDDVISTTNYAGTSVQFSVQADGTAPLAYQWYKGASLISGATNNTLSFTCAPADNGTTYYVHVSNGVGSTNSSTATLTVSTGIQIDAPLTSITRNVGSAAAFEIAAEGALPLTYQWYNGASPIAGATNQILWLSNVQLTNNGASYYVAISNPYTSTNSDPATLTVQVRAANAPTNGYAAVVEADGPVAYWRLDEASGSTNALDAVGSFNGSYVGTNGGVVNFGVATGIPNNNDPAVTVSNGAAVVVPYAIEINPPGAFTIEGWFQPASLTTGLLENRIPIASLSNPWGVGPVGWAVYQTPSNNWAWLPFRGYWDNTRITDPDVIVPNAWYYLVMTYDGTTFTLYVNGVAEASETDSLFVQNGVVPSGGANDYDYNYNHTLGLPDGGSSQFVIGWRSDSHETPFLGGIDDVAVYNKALTPQQIQNHYLNQLMLTITQSGKNTVLSWPAGSGTLQESSNVSGPYSNVNGATPPYTNSISGTTLFYRIQVTK